MQRFLVEKPITLSGKQYEPGDVVALDYTRGAVLRAAGKVRLLEQDFPTLLERRA